MTWWSEETSATPCWIFFHAISRDTLVVLELSSFQLDLLRKSPHIAVVTNITPNHLDRHGTMQNYVAAKRHIVEHQSAQDFAVLNGDDQEVAGLAAGIPSQKRWFSLDYAWNGCRCERRKSWHMENTRGSPGPEV